MKIKNPAAPAITREAEEDWDLAHVRNGRKDMSAREWTKGIGQRR